MDFEIYHFYVDSISQEEKAKLSAYRSVIR